MNNTHLSRGIAPYVNYCNKLLPSPAAFVAFHHCEQHAADMKRTYVLVALLLGVLFGPSVAKITSNPVEKDDRAIILIVRPFGFDPDGACSAVYSKVL